MKKRFWMMSVILLGVVLLAPTLAFADGHATLVRVAHLSPDAPAVDVWLDGGIVLSDVPYKTVSSYLELPSGSRRVQVTPAGETKPVVIDAMVEFESDKAYTVAATGFLGEDDLLPLVLVDDRFTMVSEAKIRFVHTSPDAPAVDVGQSDGSVVFGDVAFRKSSTYAQLPAASYDLEVRAAGTMDIALSVPGVTLEEGTNYTVFAIGSLNEGTLEALAVVDAP